MDFTDNSRDIVTFPTNIIIQGEKKLKQFEKMFLNIKKFQVIKITNNINNGRHISNFFP